LLAAFAREKPARNTAPLGADEISVYRAVLTEFAADKPSPTINISRETFTLDPSSSTIGISRTGCLGDIRLENLSSIAHSFHDLPADVLIAKNMQLVDPRKQAKIVRDNDPDKTISRGTSVHRAVENAFETGLFSLSEIGFDKMHHYAVVSFRFWCGSLCGHGSTLVFEKVNGKWHKTARTCGGWIS
jgi:hypothetical protein